MDFPFIIFVIIGLLFWVGFSYISFQQREQEKLSWQEIAQLTGLRFVPGGGFFESARVEGEYRGYSVNVETISIEKGKTSQTYTLIKLSNALKLSPDTDVDNQITTNKIATLLDPNDSNGLQSRITGSIEVAYGDLRYLKRNVQRDAKQLKMVIDYLCDLATGYPYVVSLGGEAVSFLHPIATGKENILKPVARQLLYDIEQETTRRFQWKIDDLYCSECLTRFAAHKVNLGLLTTIIYYGCRICEQSRQYYDLKGLWVILVLDDQMKDDLIQQKNILRVNWLQHRVLFDFDEIEIAQASDEDVERFAVILGNDTDPMRIGRYKHMNCTISTISELSENTLRILRRMFGQVEIKEIPKIVGTVQTK